MPIILHINTLKFENHGYVISRHPKRRNHLARGFVLETEPLDDPEHPRFLEGGEKEERLIIGQVPVKIEKLSAACPPKSIAPAAVPKEARIRRWKKRNEVRARGRTGRPGANQTIRPRISMVAGERNGEMTRQRCPPIGAREKERRGEGNKARPLGDRWCFIARLI